MDDRRTINKINVLHMHHNTCTHSCSQASTPQAGCGWVGQLLRLGVGGWDNNQSFSQELIKLRREASLMTEHLSKGLVHNMSLILVVALDFVRLHCIAL